MRNGSQIATGASPEYQPVQIRPEDRADWRVEAEFIGAIRGEEEVHLTDFATGVRYMAFTDAVQGIGRETGARDLALITAPSGGGR